MAQPSDSVIIHQRKRRPTRRYGLTLSTGSGVLSTRLLEKLNNKLNGQTVPAADLLALQIARDGIRNYVVLGDPRLELKPEQDDVRQVNITIPSRDSLWPETVTAWSLPSLPAAPL